MSTNVPPPRIVETSRLIAAAPAVIFELIADPARQPSWDGNDNLAEASPGQRVRGVGDVFRMTLTRGTVRDNHVVEFEEGRLIAWRPSEPDRDPPGHLWRWILEPVAPRTTLVTHVYDWTQLTDPSRLERARATTVDKLDASVARLAALVAPTVRVRVIGEPITVSRGHEATMVPIGNPQRLVGFLVVNGGSATLDQIGDAIWPQQAIETCRSRMRNVLMRLRRAVGDLVVRSAAGIRLRDDVDCDLWEVDRLAAEALWSARADPDVAARLAQHAIDAGEGTLFVDFESDEWAVAARRRAEERTSQLRALLSMLDERHVSSGARSQETICRTTS